MSTYDVEKVRYVSLVKIEDGSSIASVSPREEIVDPDLIAGFVTAVIIFARTPMWTIRKAVYDILIEVGDSHLLILVVDPIPDEAPYRERLRRLLHIFEGFLGISVKPSHVREIHSQLTSDDPEWMYFHLVHLLLSSLGLSWMGVLDGDPHEHLWYLLPRIGNSQGQSEIYDYVRNKVCEQIDSGCTTIGIDIDRLIHDGHFAARINSILERRLSEIKNAEVVIQGDSVNIENLLLTAYGFDMFQNGFRFIDNNCSLRFFGKIRKHLAALGIKLKVSLNATQGDTSGLSNGLRDYILEISQNNPNRILSLSSSLAKEILKKNIV
jgi:hypothetical protein